MLRILIEICPQFVTGHNSMAVVTNAYIKFVCLPTYALRMEEVFSSEFYEKFAALAELVRLEGFDARHQKFEMQFAGDIFTFPDHFMTTIRSTHEIATRDTWDPNLRERIFPLEHRKFATSDTMIDFFAKVLRYVNFVPFEVKHFEPHPVLLYIFPLPTRHMTNDDHRIIAVFGRICMVVFQYLSETHYQIISIVSSMAKLKGDR